MCDVIFSCGGRLVRQSCRTNRTGLDDADDAQRAAFQAWTGHELPGGDNGNGDAPDDEQDDRAG